MDKCRKTQMQGPRKGKPKGWHSRGYLPHIDGSELLQFVTFRLADAVPADLIERWKAELDRETNLTNDRVQARKLQRLIERYADSGMGECLLADERAAAIVKNALLHFDGIRYRLWDWTIMPHHVHVLIESGKADGYARPAESGTGQFHTLPEIVHSWKSFTSKRINEALTRSGSVWMVDYFDRYIRDEEHFEKVRDYIRRNPVSAGLCAEPGDWPWTGAASHGR